MSKYRVPLEDGGITKGFTGPSPNHWGIDYGWVSVINTPIRAIADGVCVDAFSNDSCGNSIVIRHQDNGGYRYCTFIHLNKPSTVKIGQTVKQGEIVGYRGNTGKSTGPHLHFGLTSITSKPYSWNLIKSLAINPHPLMCKAKDVKYTGVMFNSMPFLEEEDEVQILREQIQKLNEEIKVKDNQINRLSNDYAVAVDKLNKIRALV